MRSSRKFPDPVAMRIGESFVVPTMQDRNQAWTYAKRYGVVLKSKKINEDNFQMKKISGPVDLKTDSPILSHVDRANKLHFIINERRERQAGLKRQGLQILAGALDHVVPCDIFTFNNLPPPVKTVIEQIILNKNPVDVICWMDEFYEDRHISESILKCALLQVSRSKVIYSPPQMERALEVLEPRWENGVLVVNQSRRYLSKEVMDYIGQSFGVNELFIKVPISDNPVVSMGEF